MSFCQNLTLVINLISRNESEFMGLNSLDMVLCPSNVYNQYLKKYTKRIAKSIEELHKYYERFITKVQAIFYTEIPSKFNGIRVALSL